MRNSLVLISIVGFLTLTAGNSQETISLSQKARQEGYSITATGRHHRVWTQVTASNGSGKVTARTNSFVQLATGLNRWDGRKWVESKPELVETPNGIEARGSQHEALFAENINSAGSVQIKLSDGRWLKGHPLCLAYRDSSTGTNVYFAMVQDSTGQKVGKNRVVFPDAFKGVNASVSYTYTKAGISQDIRFHARPPAPESFGLNPATTHLLAITEVTESPVPQIRDRSWDAGTETMHDQAIGLGAMRMIPGRAFRASNAKKSGGFPVAKKWEMIDGRNFVVEELQWSRVKGDLLNLPAVQTNSIHAATNASIFKNDRWYAFKGLPPSPKGNSRANRTSKQIASIATTDFILDWELVDTGSESWSFTCDTTYLIDGDCYLGDADFWARSVVKYTPGSFLVISGSFNWNGDGGCGDGFATLTAVNDNSVGQPIPYGGTPQEGDYGPAVILYDCNSVNFVAGNLDVYYATQTVLPYYPCFSGVSVTVADPTAIKGATPENTAAFTITRTDGYLGYPLPVLVSIGGTATLGGGGTGDYDATGNLLGEWVTIPTGEPSTTITIHPNPPTGDVFAKSVILTILPTSYYNYTVGDPSTATVFIEDPSAPASSPVVAPSGLVSWWRGENDFADSKGSNHGTPANGLEFTSAFIGQGFNFNDGNERLTVNDNSTLNFNNNADFSIEAWIKPIEAITDYGVQSIVDKRYTPNGGTATGYSLHLIEGQLQCQISPNGAFYNFGPAGPDLRDGYYHHVAVTVDRDANGGGNLYVDGVSVLTFNPTSAQGNLSNAEKLRIGNHADPTFNGYFKGVIDEVAIYNRALSGSEIQSIYTAGRGGKCLPPVIVTQPASQTVNQGSTVNFSVVASGTSLTYQWRFNDNPISGATGSSYTIAQAQLTHQGDYRVTVANGVGSVLSSPPATLTVIRQFLLNIDLGASTPSPKTGGAKIGLAPNDFWNAGLTEGHSNLKLSDGTVTGLAFDLSGANDGDVSATVSDLMFRTYSVNYSAGNISLNLNNLAAGSYTLYLYGHGSANALNTTFTVTAGGNNYGQQATSTQAGWDSPTWQQGIQYVRFQNIQITAGQPILITASSPSITCFNGLQLLLPTGLVPPNITTQPASQTVNDNDPVTFTVGASGTAPLIYQWRANGTPIAGATSSSYTIAHAHSSDQATYSVLVANAAGSATSSGATLGVVGFVKGINLGGSDAVAIEGHPWLTHAQALAAAEPLTVQNATTLTRTLSSPNPATDTDTGKMLGSMVTAHRYFPTFAEQDAANVQFTYNRGSGGQWADRSVVFANVPANNLVQNNTVYQGWCIEHGTLDPNGTYRCSLYYSYGSPSPNYPPGTLNKVNYILNHKQSFGPASNPQIQCAIWTILGTPANGCDNNDPISLALVAAANANGATYVPGPGDIAGIVVEPYTGNMQQSILVEVPITANNATSFVLSQTIANGNYSVYLWFAESEFNNARRLDAKIENATVSGPSGVADLALNHWTKLGPYPANVADGALTIQVSSAVKGDPILMGMAIFTTATPPVNQPPTITLGNPVTYIVSQPPLVNVLPFAPSATITDPEVGFDTWNLSGTLTIKISQNVDGRDRISIRPHSTNPEPLDVNNDVITWNGLTLGNIVSGGTGNNPLLIHVLGSPHAIRDLLRNLTFENSSDNPSRLDRTVEVTMKEDGVSQSSQPATKLVHVQGLNKPPIVDAGLDQSIGKPGGANAVTLLEGFVSDDGLPVGSNLSIVWSVDETPDGVPPGAVTFSSPDSPTSKASFPSIGRYVLRLTANDSTGPVSDTMSVTVCDTAQKAKDMILVLDHTHNTGYPTAGRDYVLYRASQLKDFLPSSIDRVGLIGFKGSESPSAVALQHILTPDRNSIDLASSWGSWTELYDSVSDAIRVAAMEFTGPRQNPEADQVIVIFGSLVQTTVDEKDGFVAANEAKASGIRIICIGLANHDGTFDTVREEFYKKIASDHLQDYYRITDPSEGLPAAVAQTFKSIAERLCAPRGIKVNASGPKIVSRPLSGTAIFNVTATATSVTPGPISYSWQYFSDLSLPGGSESFTISSPSSAATSITVAGTPNSEARYCFKVTAIDAAGNSGVANVIVVVSTTPIDDVFLVAHGAADVKLDVLQNDPYQDDPTNPNYHLISDIQPRWPSWLEQYVGECVISSDERSLLYTPAPDFDAGFEYFLCYFKHLDGSPVLDSTGQPLVRNVKIFVSAYNEPPVAHDDTAIVLRGTTEIIEVLTNDQEPNHGDTNFYAFYQFQIVSTTQPTLGSVQIIRVLRHCYLQYQSPVGGPLGIDHFSYTLQDSYGLRSTGAVTVTVTDNINLAGWKAENDLININAAESFQIIDVLLNDQNVNDPVNPPTTFDSVSAVTPASAGAAVKLDVGPGNPFPHPAVKFTPNNRSAPATFTYRLAPGSNPDHQATVSVGFRANITPNVQAVISNLDPATDETYRVVRQGLLEVQGTARDANNSAAFVNYHLVVYDAQDNELRRQTYDGIVSPGNVLGVLDLTTLPDGFYRIDLEVFSIPSSPSPGSYATTTAFIMLHSALKIGRFALSLADLSIPVQGVPVTVGRTYDSFDPSVGEFGKAWHLSIGAGHLKKSGVLGLKWKGAITGLGAYCVRNLGQMVTIKLGSGKELKFAARVNVNGTENGPNCAGSPPSTIGRLEFDPLPGTLGELKIVDPPTSLMGFPQGGNWAGYIDFYDDENDEWYDPDKFVYTDLSGRAYNFENGRVISIKDRNNNQITFDFDGTGNDGITYQPASGPSKFLVQVDHEGDRITRIYGPSELPATANPATLLYEYRTYTGDKYLARVKRLTDKSDPAHPVYQTTAFLYELQGTGDGQFDHYITRIQGPVGAVRNEYDEKGRLSATIDPIGARTEIDHNDGRTEFISPNAKGRETVTDALGHKTIHEYDARGNIVLFEDALHHRTTVNHAYEASGNRKLSESITDPLNHTKTTSYSYQGDTELVGTTTVIPPHTLVPGDPTRDQDSDFQTAASANQYGQTTDVTDANQHPMHIDYVNDTDVNPSNPDHVNYLNAWGKVKRMVDAQGKETLFYYRLGPNNVPDTEEFDPLKNKAVTLLNELGYEIQTAEYPNIGTVATPQYSAQPATKTEFNYDDNGETQTETTTRILSTGDIETVRQTFVYDAAARPLKTVVETKINLAAFTPIPSEEPEITYDDAGRKKTETRTRKLSDGTLDVQVIKYDYNERGDLVRTTYPDRTFTATTFDLLGRVFARTDRAGLSTTNLYDDAGRLIQNLAPDRSSITNEYDEAGRVLASTDRLGLRTTYTYDEAGRRKTISTPDLKVTQFFYDKMGNLEKTIDSLTHYTSYLYDGRNRPTRVTYDDGTYQETRYNDLGKHEEEIDQAGVSTRFEYDGLGRLLHVIKPYKIYNMLSTGPVEDPSANPPPDAVTTSFEYDEVGNLTKQTDGEGRITKFEYDAFGRKKKHILPNLKFEEFTYDELGNLVSRDDFNDPPNRRKTKFEYDSNGRLVGKIPDPTFNSDPVVITYTSTGLRESVKYPVGPGPNNSEEVTFHYLNDRLWKKVTPQGTLTYDYDANGNLSSLTTSRGTAVTYKWDSQNRLRSVDDTTDAVDPTSYTYDDPGNLKTVTYPNGVLATYNYNNLNRLTDLAVTHAADVLATFNYNPNEANRTLGPTGVRRAARETINLTATDIIKRNVNYDYDTLYRLKKEDISLPVGNTVSSLALGTIVYDATPGYTDLPVRGFDRVGNRHSRELFGANTALQTKVFPFSSRNYDINDRIDNDAIPNNTNPNYDNNGNTLSALPGDLTPAQTAADEYDFEDRLVTRRTTLDSKAATIDLAYDADGNRIKKTITQTIGGTTTTKTTSFLVDDRNPTRLPQVIEEAESVNGGAASLTRRYVHGHTLISQKDGVGTVHYYVQDGHGNVRFLTESSSTANITDAYNYEASGILVDEWHAGTPTINNFLYCGEQFDPHLGLYYLRARYMNPRSGVFWTMDSNEGNQYDPQSLHRYLYCQSDPVNRNDPSGHESLIGVSISTTVATSLSCMYNGVVGGVGSAMMFTIEGVQLGKTENQILADFILDETGIQSVLDIYDLTKDWLVSHFRSEETAALVEHQLWLNEVFLQAALSISDGQYGEFEINFEIEQEPAPQCFLAGTIIATDHGPVAIESLDLNENVWTWDQVGKELRSCPVVGRFVHEKTLVYAVGVSGDLLWVTSEHPFYVLEKGWTEAQHLEVGDKLQSLTGEEASVTSLEKHSGSYLVYNFEVSPNHNYFVGLELVLTHNSAASRTLQKFKRSWSKYVDFHHIVAFAHKNGKDARDALKKLGLTTEIAENGVELPKSLTARKKLDQKKWGWVAPHHGSGLHSKEVFDNIAKELNDVWKKFGNSEQGRERALKVLKEIGNTIQEGTYPGMK